MNEPESVPDGDLPGSWTHSDFLGGDPDERSYADRGWPTIVASIEFEINTSTSSGENLLLTLFGGDPRPPFAEHSLPERGQE